MPEPPSARRRLVVAAVLAGLIVAVTLIAAGLLAGGAPQRRLAPVRQAGPRLAQAAPVAPPPPVAPTVLADLTPDEARTDNALHALSTEAFRPAPPFLFAGRGTDRAAARACLAAAVLYEAGDDATGEQAVAQVVLNRIRHPAFPKTVCGVVFQGAERSTGCQFTFACDGALDRPPSPKAWARAETIADAALSGHVDKAVGPATHYHADYVVPYWRDSLDKLAKVGAHIFYRWPGWWGSSAALTGRLQPFERLDPRLVALAGPEAVAAPDVPPDPEAPPALPQSPLVSLSIDGVPRSALKGAIVRAKDERIAQYVLELDAGAFPGSWAIAGFSICADHADCLVLGWTQAALTPRTIPVSPLSMRQLAFMYRKSSVLGTAQPLWDCRRYARPTRTQCLPGTAPAERIMPTSVPASR